MANKLTVDLVRCEDGSIDVAGSEAAFSGALSRYIAECETEDTEIAKAVESIFDRLNGTRCNMPYIVNQALQVLNVQPANHKVLFEKVSDFIRANAHGDDAVYHIGKGKGGYVIRLSDESDDARKKRLAVKKIAQ
jgi:cupin superfamily acireductone dioxygenase involved in methionine salvage